MCKESGTAERDQPLAPVGVKNICAPVTIKITDGGVAQEWSAAIDRLPPRCAAPGNVPPAAVVLGEDIGAPVGVEITKQQRVDLINLGVKVTPFGLARRGVIPSGAGS